MADVAIIGAGIGGLVLGAALVRAGTSITIHERAEVLGELGAGITLSPNAVRVINWLGLGDDLARIGFVPDQQLTQHWQSGAVIRQSRRGPDFAASHGGAGYFHVHRADLHALLVSSLPAGVLHLGRQLVDVAPDGRMHFADGSQDSAALVVGADGVKSAVRAACFGSDQPQFTGQVAWRGIVPVEALPADVQAMPPGIHIGPQRLFMRYPVRGGRLINYAAFVELQGWTDESWTIPSTTAELLGHFADWDAMVPAIIRATPDHLLFKWALHAREPLTGWINGRVTLLGDAAHAMLPFMGQGAATAIEDAAVLARCLTGFPVDEALIRYEQARRARTEMVQTQSRLLGLQLQGKDPASLGRGPLMNEEALGLFDYDAVNVPV